MDISLKNEPVSTKNPSFLALVDEHLANNEVIIILVRYPNYAGVKDYLLIRTKDEFDALLKKLASKTSVTAFFESAFVLRGKVNAKLLKNVERLFAKEYKEYEGLDIIYLEAEASGEGERNILFMQELESIEEWLRLHKGCQVLIGTMKFWYDNNKDFLTAYVPDKDSQICPGAY